MLQDSDSDSDSDVSTADEVTVAARNNDGTVSSAAQHELQIAADLAAQPAWFGGGRFGGREGKLARIRQQEALAAAKLGLACAKADLAPAVASVKVSKKRKTPSKTVTDTQAATKPSAESAIVTVTAKKGKGSKKQKQEATGKQAGHSAEAASTAAEAADDVPVVTKKRIVVEPVFTATVPAVPFVQTPSVGWWGAKKFKSAGCLEGIDQQQNKAQSERQQFDEDDQANLYIAAQNLKTSGKKGLGTKSHIGELLTTQRCHVLLSALVHQVQLHPSRSPWQLAYSRLWIYVHTRFVSYIGRPVDPQQKISVAQHSTSSSCKPGLNASVLSLHADLSSAANHSSLRDAFVCCHVTGPHCFV